MGRGNQTNFHKAQGSLFSLKIRQWEVRESGAMLWTRRDWNKIWELHSHAGNNNHPFLSLAFAFADKHLSDPKR